METTKHNQAIIITESQMCWVMEFQTDPQVIPHERGRLRTNINTQS